MSPLLAPSDLFFTLNTSLKLDIHSPEDLVHPRADHIRRLYLSLMGLCYSKPVSAQKLSTKASKSLGEVSEEMKAALGLFPHLAELLKRVKSGVQLELRDLISPTEDRTRKVLSDLVNFIRYRTDEELLLSETDEMRLLAEEEAEVDSLRTRIAAVKEEIAVSKSRKEELDIPISAKKQKILELERDRRHMEEEKDAIEAEIAAMGEGLVENPQAATLRQQFSTAKARQIELQQLYSTLESAISHIHEVKRLFSDIQRYQSEIEALQASVSEKRALLATLTLEVEDLQGTIDAEQTGAHLPSPEVTAIEGDITGELQRQQHIQNAIESLREEHERRLREIGEKQEELMRVAERCRGRIEEVGAGRVAEIYL